MACARKFLQYYPPQPSVLPFFNTTHGSGKHLLACGGKALRALVLPTAEYYPRQREVPFGLERERERQQVTIPEPSVGAVGDILREKHFLACPRKALQYYPLKYYPPQP